MAEETPVPLDASGILERFMADFDKARNIADPLKPQKVVARVHQQLGRDVLIAMCPKCGTIAGLDGEGKHLCRQCHTWLHYVRPE